MATRKAVKSAVSKVPASRTKKASPVAISAQAIRQPTKAQAAKQKAAAAKARRALARNKAIWNAAITTLRVLGRVGKRFPVSAPLMRNLVNDAIDTQVTRHGLKHGFNANHVTRAANLLLAMGADAANRPKLTLSQSFKASYEYRSEVTAAAISWSKNNPVTG